MCQQISWIMMIKWKKNFAALQAAVWTSNKRCPGPPGFSPGSATLLNMGVTTQGKLFLSQWPKGQKMATTLSLITEHLLWAPIVARNPNLQVVITHMSHVGSQHSFEIPLRMNGMHRTQFDHKGLDLLSLVIWSRPFWPSVTWSLHKA